MIIDNQKFFHMIHNQIRKSVLRFEERELLSIALNILNSSEINFGDLEDYPIEGYYYKSEELRKYFKIIRNLQSNDRIFKKVQNSDELKVLQKVTSSDLWGTEDSHFAHPEAPLKRRRDILSICLEEDFDLFQQRPWDINCVICQIGSHYTGNPNLVEFAYLIDDQNRTENNPLCLTLAAETNILYRDIPIASGYLPSTRLPTIEWNVDRNIEEFGLSLIRKYNSELFNKEEIILPTFNNCQFLNMKPELPVVARLGEVRLTGEHYHWIANSNGKVEEIYSDSIITTENYKNLVETK
jgi:hypothetical protein